ncbi:carboxylate--amine ligase, partial [Kocuria sp. CPCC 205281]
RAGLPPTPVGVTALRAWSWRAARSGVEGQLVSPTTGTPAAAGDVVTELLQWVDPVLAEQHEDEEVHAVVTDILREGSGARVQRDAYATHHQWREVIEAALTQGTPTAAEPSGNGEV